MIPVADTARHDAIAELTFEFVSWLCNEVLASHDLMRSGESNGSMSVRLSVSSLTFIGSVAQSDRTIGWLGGFGFYSLWFLLSFRFLYLWLLCLWSFCLFCNLYWLSHYISLGCICLLGSLLLLRLFLRRLVLVASKHEEGCCSTSDGEGSNTTDNLLAVLLPRCLRAWHLT